MSAAKSAIGKLPSGIQALVLSSAEQIGSSANGKTANDESIVVSWIEKVAGGNVVKEASLKELDEELTPKTYLATNYLTTADIALYGALHPIICKLQPSQRYSQPSVSRYFDHIQNLPAARKYASADSFPLVNLDIDNAPAQERKSEPVQKKKKEGKAPAEASAVTVSKVDEATAPTNVVQQQAQKKEKKKETAVVGDSETGGKKKAGKASAAPVVAEDAGEPKPSMIDLRIGKIIDIKRHPDADGLYVEQIDVGEETGPRTVISGLVHYIPIEKLQDKLVVVVANLKPANMRGIKSHAMLLCATHKDGKEAGLETVEPPAGAKPGDRVYFEGSEYEEAAAMSQLNPKKKIFETIQPGFTTLESKEAAWINPVSKSVHRMRTKDGFCTSPMFVGASLS